WHGWKGLPIETRSGNAAKPDATWSGFTGLDRPHATAEGGVGQVGSPSARYVQYRVTFDAPDGKLGAVSLAYLPQNQRARITELGTAEGGGTGTFGGTTSGSSLGGSTTTASPAARAHSSIQKLRWKVENPDGDE